ncbi:MAG: RNA 2',3'-cyclic phosphodiesterase, partial [Candidatus Rokuibacteriota bacterium]
MAVLRAFVAITLPPALQRSLESEAAPLGHVIPGVSWVQATNLHMTLKFLGDVEETRVETIATGLTSAAAQVEAFDLTIRGLGAFPTLARPQVIWAGASGPRLGALVESIERALEPLGFPRETRPFSAHITLGRVRAKSTRSLSREVGTADRRLPQDAEENRGDRRLPQDAEENRGDRRLPQDAEENRGDRRLPQDAE